MKTLEAYLKENFEKNISEHSVGVFSAENGEVRFYIHPQGKDGDTLDFVAKGNLLLASPSDDSHLEPACRSGREEKKRFNQCQDAIERLLEGFTISECESILGVVSSNLQEVAKSRKFALDQIEERNWAFQRRSQPGKSVKQAPVNPENEQFRSIAN